MVCRGWVGGVCILGATPGLTYRGGVVEMLTPVPKPCFSRDSVRWCAGSGCNGELDRDTVGSVTHKLQLAGWLAARSVRHAAALMYLLSMK